LAKIVGDIHQPLHDENWEVGGNKVNVTYNGGRTNLHHIWDTNMLEDDAGGYSLSVASNWASNLTTRINSGEYKSASSWLDGLDVTKPVDSVMAWASDANSYVCSTVLESGLTYVENNDLSGDYYSTCKPVFEVLLARAGYRLAAWLDAIADNASSPDSKN
jgi:S1/P1 Nuclease